MTEYLSREEVQLYLDDRKSKGMNVVQLCLFWGKREERPTRFTPNAPNFYGHRAFVQDGDYPDPKRPDIKEGPEDDYWDHVDFVLKEIKARNMYAAILPFWGRRYVNASLEGQSLPVFTIGNIFEYGHFLGKRYGKEPHAIWVNGGDVKADAGGDFLGHYRLLAEGLVEGTTGRRVRWNEGSEEWNSLSMTYHPDGDPMVNSSEWFHLDKWLDFNMIETHIYRDKVAASIRQDLSRNPTKPTVLAEGHYEGLSNADTVEAIHIRRQAYQTFFAGAAGHSYGGFLDADGNGPLFSPSNNWTSLLSMKGSSQIIHLRNFLEEHSWEKWHQTPEYIIEGRGDGELEKMVVQQRDEIYIYFPDNSECIVAADKKIKGVKWFDPETGTVTAGVISENNVYDPPANLKDALLLLTLSTE